jgi:hypothetical protein
LGPLMILRAGVTGNRSTACLPRRGRRPPRHDTGVDQVEVPWTTTIEQTSEGSDPASARRCIRCLGGCWRRRGSSWEGALLLVIVLPDGSPGTIPADATDVLGAPPVESMAPCRALRSTGSVPRHGMIEHSGVDHRSARQSVRPSSDGDSKAPLPSADLPKRSSPDTAPAPARASPLGGPAATRVSPTVSTGPRPAASSVQGSS